MKNLQKTIMQPAIYRGGSYRLHHKYRGIVEGIVINERKVGDPHIELLPMKTYGRGKSQSRYINLGFVSKVEVIG